MTTENANTPAPATEKQTEVTLELWQFSPPAQFAPGMVTTKRYDNGSMVAGLALAKRKDMAVSLGLKGKDNKTALDAELLKLSDRIKEAGMAEFAKLASSADWTGKRFQIRQDKNGGKTATMVIKSVKRSSEVTVDQMSASLAKMTPAERKACLDRLLAAAAPAGEIVDQPAPEQLPPAGPEQPEAKELEKTTAGWTYPEDLKLEQWMIDEDTAQIAEWRAAGMSEEDIKVRMEEAIELYRMEMEETANAAK